MKKYNYNYIITNELNDLCYIGSHSTNKLFDDYLGSGVILNRDKKLYGKENFKLSIITFTFTIEQAKINEPKLIAEYDTLFPRGYNKSRKGGDLSVKDKNSYLKISDEKIDYYIDKLYELYSDYNLIDYKNYLIIKDNVLKRDYRILRSIENKYVKMLNHTYNHLIYFGN